MGPSKTSKVLNSKRNHKQDKRQPSEWQKIFANVETNNGSISKIHKQLMKLNIKKSNNPIKKRVEDLNKHFSKDVQMAKKHMKRCLTSLIIREMKIKTTVTFFTSHQSEQLSSKKPTNNKCWKGCEEKANPLHCRWKCKLEQLLWRKVWRFLIKLQTELVYDPVILSLDIYPEKITIQKDTYTPMFIQNSQEIEAT